MKKECENCSAVMELTDKYWYRNRHTKTGFSDRVCKSCQKEKRRRGAIKQEAKRTFSAFEKSCLEDRIKRAMEPAPSVFL